MKCLFLVQGAPFPAECAISAKFIVDIRTVCYRYKNEDVNSRNNNGGAAELDYSTLNYESGAIVYTPQRSDVRASKIVRYEPTTPTKLVSEVGHF
jgi:hypothetical protein